MKKKLTCGLLAFLLCLSTVMGTFVSTPFIGAEVAAEQAGEEEIPAYLDVRLSYKERAADLISRMSLEEKQAQLIPAAPAIPRLGVSAYKYQNEALHGIMSNDGGTSFPSPITTASSWNLELMQEVGTIVSDEIRAYYNAASGRGLSYYSPTMNLLRDPRWGRNEEAYSEDPFLTAVMGEQFVRGLQGIGDGHVNNNPNSAEYGYDYIKVAPTLKHYAANSSEKNRNSGTYDIDNKTLRDYYTWSFQRIVEKTGVASVMSAYNRINGVPCSANSYLLDTLLRKTFGFTGFVVNDCGAINDTILNHKWKPEGYNRVVTPAEAVALSLKAGNNMDCGGGSMDTVYDDYTVQAVEQGLISEAEIDQILLEIFLTRFRTGEFDGVDGSMGSYTKAEGFEWFNPNQYHGGTTLPESAANVQKSVEAGMQGAVLLKNNGNALPIANPGSIKVFGPLMNCWDLGDYSGWPKSERITFKKGMQLVAGEKGQAVEFYDGMTANVPENTNNLLRVRAIGFYPGAGIVDASSGTETYNLSKAAGGYLTNIKDNSYIKFENVDLTKMSAEEVRVFSASGNDIKVNAEFHLDSPNGTILATVQCLPTGNDLYDGTLPTKFDNITSSNWKAAGFSSKVSSEQGSYNEAFGINKFNRALWDFARGENGGLHDIYVTFSYDRTPVMNNSQIAKASHDGVSVVYIGTATANARDTNDKATFGAYRVCNEASDRPNIKVPAGQEVLVNEVAKRTKAAGGKTVVVIQSVGVMDVSAFEENVDAIIWTA
ncbi:MAG: glycoside hydrolase family 3 C-terminal domain-containing protein [Clostridia bacterium]|nr:glycoside hydrolase family 3 C-terminal domain-containing protein [Clostridia bacterium]